MNSHTPKGPDDSDVSSAPNQTTNVPSHAPQPHQTAHPLLFPEDVDGERYLLDGRFVHEGDELELLTSIGWIRGHVAQLHHRPRFVVRTPGLDPFVGDPLPLDAQWRWPTPPSTQEAELNLRPRQFSLPSMEEVDRKTTLELIRQVAGCRLSVAANLIRALPRGTLQRATRDQLLALGCSSSQALRLVSAFSLTRRLWAQEAAKSLSQVITPHHALEVALRELHGREQEQLLGIYLDSSNQVLGTHMAGIGTATQVQISPREIFRDALRLGAQGVIVAHNHPSGSPTPSEADLLLTLRLREIGVLVGVPLLDHLVIGQTAASSILDSAPR